MSTDDQNRIPLPQEAAVNYTLDLRVEFATDAAIPATVVEIIDDDDDALRVTATFAGHPELAETGVFVISLHGDQLDCVSVTYFEPAKGAYDNLPMAGATKGVFQALIEMHRTDLDLLRTTVAHDRDIKLKPAKESMRYTVYFRYRFNKDDRSWTGDLHYGHRVVDADYAVSLSAAVDLVMAEEKASMIGHAGDRGAVEFVYATNGVDPDEGLWGWQCGADDGSACGGAK